MKYPRCREAGLIIENGDTIILNEEKLFRQWSYQEVIEYEFDKEVTTIDRGKVKVDELEKFLEKKAAKA